MYKKFPIYETDYLAEAQTVPQNTNADGTANTVARIFQLAGQNGNIKIVARVNSDVVIHNGTALTVKLQGSADGTSYTDYATLYTKSMSADTTIAADTKLGELILPNDCPAYIKANLVTTDASATGKIDVFQLLVSH